MRFHRLAISKWLLKALFGPLAADGDSTGGSNVADAPAPGPAAEPDHPSLAELKAKCTREWKAWPVKVGTKPFKAEPWKYFYPCEDPSKLDLRPERPGSRLLRRGLVV